MTTYRTFTRTWWKENPKWPNGLEPEAGERRYYDDYEDEQEALDACEAWNSTHEPGRYSKKMEYEKD